LKKTIAKKEKKWWRILKNAMKEMSNEQKVIYV